MLGFEELQSDGPEIYIRPASEFIHPTYEATDEERHANFAVNMLHSTRELLHANGFAIDLAPRDDSIVVTDYQGYDFLVIRSQYRGFTDFELIDRKCELEAFKVSWQADRAANPGRNQAAERLAHMSAAKHIADHGGVRGVETYAMTATCDYAKAAQAAIGRLSVARASFAVSRTFPMLSEERKTYDLPAVRGGFSAFPFNPTERSYAWATGLFKR